jgi:hypothetical protein
MEKIILKISKDPETNAATLHFKRHHFDPDLCGGILYLVLNRYLNHVPESDQIEFLDATLKVFKHLMKDQQGYTLMKLDQND